MLIFTNRTVSGTGTRRELGRAFTPYADALTWAAAQAVDDKKWRLDRLTVDSDDARATAALLEVFDGGRPVLLYLHGFNNTPQACFQRCARLEALYDVNVVGFSWPSEGALSDGSDLPAAPNPDPGNEELIGDIGGRFRGEDFVRARMGLYQQAKNNAMGAVDSLARFLRLVAVARLQANAQPFSLAAHSMGVHLLQYSLALDATREALGSAFNIALVAGCARASGHKDWVPLLRPKGRVFITYNQNDTTLAGATVADGGQVKLGMAPGPERVRSGAVRYLCFSGATLDPGGHSYFAWDKLPKRSRKVFARVFGSEADLRDDEVPRKIYPAGCDPDGVTCYFALQPDGPGI